MLAMPEYMLAAQDPAEDQAAACSLKHLKDIARVGQFVFKSYKSDDDGGCLQVLRGSRIIFRRTVDSREGYTLGQSQTKKWKVPAIANGTDITGRGRPDMIVSFYTGGAHCCTFHYIFELEPEFKMLATLNAADTWPAYFADLDGNQHYYYLAEDWTFAYWPSSFAGSPSAPIVLKFLDENQGSGYHLALDKMSKPAPSPAEWEKTLRDARAPFEHGSWIEDMGATLWYPVLNFIYSGHSDLAWKLIDEAWPAKVPGKNKWLEDFCSILKTSPYWPDLAASVKDPPRPCVVATPDQSRKR